MRQIKFRAKDTFKSEFFPQRWLYGTPVQDGDDVWMCVKKEDKGIVSVKVDPSTLGQFTGLTDRNGKEIYDGDIFTVNGKYPRVILWDKMCWALMPTEYFHDEMFWVMNLQHPGIDWWEEFADEFEVIGNIHDNPELIPNQPTEV